MTSEEVSQLLQSNLITYNNKDHKWYYGRAEIGPASNVVLMPMFMSIPMSDIEFIQECMTVKEANMNKGVTSLTDMVVGIFLDELQMDPRDRKHLDRTIPQYVVPKGFRSFPYEKNCPARKCNEAKLRAYFNHMIYVSQIKLVNTLKQPDQVLTFYIDRAKRMVEDEIIAKTKYKPSTEQSSDYALRELYNLYKPAFISFGNEQRFDFGMFKAVIKHFIWHIKNKAIYGQNKEPIMLNISGEQGNGKTQFIRHLFKSILGDLYVETTISVLNDEFGTNLLYESWLLFFDELIRKNGELDVDRLKQVITSTEIKSREIFTSHYTTTFVRSSFIGAANTPIYEIIDDPTGMRRYLNLEFTNNKIVHDKELHPMLDELWQKRGLAIWQSVDENLPNGYLVDEYAEMMEAAQKTYFSPNNTVYRFLHDERIQIVTKGTKSTLTGLLDTLYNESYLEYCKKHDILPNYRTSIEGFKKRVKDLYDSKNGTKCKVANLRYVCGSIGEVVPAPETGDKFTNLLTMPTTGSDTVDQRLQLVIPDSYDKYKDFAPVEVPEADIIIKVKKESNGPAIKSDAKFVLNENGGEVYNDFIAAVDSAKPGESVYVVLDGSPLESHAVKQNPEEENSESAKPETENREPVCFKNDKGQTVFNDVSVASKKIHPGQTFTFEQLDSLGGELTKFESHHETLPEIEIEMDSLESKIDEIHRIHRSRPWAFGIDRLIEDARESGGFVDSDPFYFRKQAIRMHDDLFQQFGTDENINDIEKILKIQHEAINDFI